jgi:hypothetical protein
LRAQIENVTRRQHVSTRRLSPCEAWISSASGREQLLLRPRAHPQRTSRQAGRRPLDAHRWGARFAPSSWVAGHTPARGHNTACSDACPVRQHAFRLSSSRAQLGTRTRSDQLWRVDWPRATRTPKMAGGRVQRCEFDHHGYTTSSTHDRVPLAILRLQPARHGSWSGGWVRPTDPNQRASLSRQQELELRQVPRAIGRLKFNSGGTIQVRTFVTLTRSAPSIVSPVPRVRTPHGRSGSPLGNGGALRRDN